MVFEHIYIGGIYFMLPIVALWLVTLVLGTYTVAKAQSGPATEKLRKTNNLVLFLGSFAFLIGLLAQVIGLLEAFQAIERAGDISPALIAGGLRVSFIAPVYGFVLFIISLLVWFINRNYLLK